MAPLPKRKHSTQRKKKRMATKTVKLPQLVICKNCGKSKLSHRVCRHCGK